MSNSALKIQNVSKNFLLPHERIRSVKSAFVQFFRRRIKNRTVEVQHALRDINFEIKQGEFFGVLGRNGSGKSTLLKLMAGVYTPNHGTVQVNGKLVPFIELGVGFNPELTGRENVYLNGALLGFSKAEIDKQYDSIVDFAELEKFMDQKLKNYSSGMQVRLAFSVAIIANADILLVDEVLAVGDADFQRKCFEYFKALKKAKKTVVFVTHDMNAVREYCDRAILINESRLVAEGTADEIATKYNRLFVDEDVNSEEISRETKRWGDGSATVSGVHVDKSTLTDEDKEITVRIAFTANKDLENPVCGFSIKDAADNQLFGTNTKIKNVRLGVMKAGETREVVWRFANILAEGKHFINATVQRSDSVTACDWWEEAAEIKSHKSERTAYRITPAIDVEIV